MASWIRTYTKRKFYPLNPRAKDLDIYDIAHALSNLCRFTGHCTRFYSVAEHCVRVAMSLRDEPIEVQFWGLLHDASEAYLNDLSTPVKHTLALKLYRRAEKRLMKVIAKRFKLEGKEPKKVKRADRRLLKEEMAQLIFDHPGTFGWSPEIAEEAFLNKFHHLCSSL